MAIDRYVAHLSEDEFDELCISLDKMREARQHAKLHAAIVRKLKNRARKRAETTCAQR